MTSTAPGGTTNAGTDEADEADERGADLIAALVPHPADGPLAAARAQRPDVVSGTQDSYTALFDPRLAQTTLTTVERLQAALRVATLHDGGPATRRLAGHYRAALVATGAPEAFVDAAATGAGRADRGAPGDRSAALLDHATLLARAPLAATADHHRRLADAGLSADEAVTLSQVAAYVSYQARLVHGLDLLAQHPGPGQDGPAGPVPDGAELPEGEIPFTLDTLEWDPWLPPLDPDWATEEQSAGLAASPDASWPYFRLLARDPHILRHRTSTDRGIFRGAGGLPRAERELAATVASRVNGCVFCASVHSRLAARLADRRTDVQRLLDHGPRAGFGARWDALVAFAARLSTTAPTADAGDLARLRALGLSELEIVDLVQATAFFAWANRLMLTLGEPRRVPHAA
ncbi:CMD domain-containing protein [Kitasatospora sp. NPDC092286]|uniref:CMD domain-containing protein n=1 Tax=Kitasatospora sp. NPDC092286 TaxID=3364087 RepID=UPI003820D2FB